MESRWLLCIAEYVHQYVSGECDLNNCKFVVQIVYAVKCPVHIINPSFLFGYKYVQVTARFHGKAKCRHIKVK